MWHTSPSMTLSSTNNMITCSEVWYTCGLFYALDYSFVADTATKIWCICYDPMLQNKQASYREHLNITPNSQVSEPLNVAEVDH